MHSIIFETLYIFADISFVYARARARAPEGKFCDYISEIAFPYFYCASRRFCATSKESPYTPNAAGKGHSATTLHRTNDFCLYCTSKSDSARTSATDWYSLLCAAVRAALIHSRLLLFLLPSIRFFRFYRGFDSTYIRLKQSIKIDKSLSLLDGTLLRYRYFGSLLREMIFIA